MKFKKKPVEVEAWRWPFNDYDEKFINPISKRLPNKYSFDPCAICKESMIDHADIHTLEGIMTACPGDWIIKGIKGEFYPIKDEIFRASYEAIE